MREIPQSESRKKIKKEKKVLDKSKILWYNKYVIKRDTKSPD